MTKETAERIEPQELEYKRMLEYQNSRTFSGVAILNKRGSGILSLEASVFQSESYQGRKEK